LNYESEGDERSTCNSRRAALRSGEGNAARPGVGQRARLRVASRAPPPRGRGWGGERDTGQPGEVRLRAAWGSASSADPSSLAMDGERPGVGRCEASRPTSGAPAGPNPSSRSILSWRPEEREDGKQRWSSGGVVCWVVYSCVDSCDGPCVVSRGGVFFFPFPFLFFCFLLEILLFLSPF